MFKKSIKLFLVVLLYLWQLPQNIVGALLVLILEPELSFPWNGVRIHYAQRMHGGISLGRYVILANRFLQIGDSEKHEYGHCLQSKMLGPLYLLIIGLPSLFWAVFYRDDETDPDGYYRFFTEKWADRLGGVNR